MDLLSNSDAKALCKAVLSLKNEAECKKFLRDLLTEAEIKELTNRWKAARMLNNKIDYKTIERETKMSSTTIARINKWLKDGMGGYRLVLKRLSPDRSNPRHHTPTRLAV